MAGAEDIEIYEGQPTRAYRSLGPVKAKVGARTALSKAPTVEAVNVKLREQAAELGANAVINVEHKRGMSATSWKALTASGEAFVLESDNPA